MPPKVIKDLDHPDFPHGQAIGYSRGCHRECCMAAERRADKLREFRRQAGIPQPPRSVPDDAARRAREHMKMLTKRHNISLGAIADAANIGRTTVINAHQGKPMSPRTYKAIMAVKHSDVERSLGALEPSGPTVTLIGQMLALGYSMRWQESQVGLGRDSLGATSRLHRAGKQLHVEARTARLIEDLSRRVGDSPAEPDRDGIDPREIQRAKAIARRHGYWPPEFYDERGELDWNRIPGHPWAVTDEWCHGLIQNLHVILTNPDLGPKGLARVVNNGELDDSTERAFDRMLDRMKVRESDPGRDERRAALLEAVDAFYAGEGTPVAFVIDHGLAKLSAQEIARDHPHFVSHPARKEQLRAREASRAASRARSRAIYKQQREQRSAQATTEAA